MMRAMYAAISGLRNHITYMDVVGNNIANVNTAGFKSARVSFQDMLSQTTAGASQPTAERGGTNPMQVGLGVQVGSIDVTHTQGSLQSTGKLTDFAIQGNGFFVVKDGNRAYYTRDGAFDISSNGELVNPSNGYKVQGWQANASGQIDTTLPMTSITVPYGQAMGAQSSGLITLQGNLDSRSATGTEVSSVLEIFDSLGKPHPITLKYTKAAAANTWNVTVATTDTSVSSVAASPASVVFGTDGQVTTPAPPAPIVITTNLTAASGAVTPVKTDISIAKVTQFATNATMAATSNNGYAAGSLVSFSVGPSGEITGIFSNGTNRSIGQLGMALFSNVAGLQRSGANTFEPTSNSGIAVTGTPGTGGRGLVGTGVLEGSNTDLAREFTNVVIAQRGFQASSRVITSADEMLQDLVNLKR